MGIEIVAAGLLGGIGSYFGGKAQESASREQAGVSREQIAENKRQADLNEAFRREQMRLEQAELERQAKERQEAIDRERRTKYAASGIISGGYDTSGYGKELNYVDPYAGSVKSAIDTLLSGGLTEAELRQQGKALESSNQIIGANAATMGLPAGARAALGGQSTQAILDNYANMGAGRVGQGLSAADTATRTGADIANINYQSGLANFLKEQELKNRKTEIMAGYATPLPTISEADMAKYGKYLTKVS